MKRIDFQELSLYTVPARGRIDYIYLHWTGGHYGQCFPDYHINIDEDGTLYIEMSSFMERKSHTWRRNSRSIGIALDCCAGAYITKEGTAYYGEEPPTETQIDMLAMVVAKLCVEIGLSLDVVLTHAEVADIDGYGLYDSDPDMRWDLYGMGDEIRYRAQEYINQWQS